MNQPRGFDLRRVTTIAIVLLVVGIALLFWARDIVRELVVLPLSYLFWVIGLFIKSTPQLFFWIALLVISFVIAYRGLAGKKKAYFDPTFRMKINEVPDHRLVTGRVVYWRSKVNLMQAGQGVYFQNAFHVAVARLLIDQLAHRYRLTSGQVEQHLKDGLIDVPDEVRTYALASLERRDDLHNSFFALLWRSFLDQVRTWLNRWTQTPITYPMDPQCARVLQYMEEELEVSHDHPGQ